MDILEATPEDTPAIMEFFQIYQFPLRHQQWFEWKYSANPAGEASRFKLVVDGRIAGTVALVPQYFTYLGRRVVGLQAVDGLIGMELRGKGNFNTLMAFLSRQKPLAISEDYFFLGCVSVPASIKALENARWTKLFNFSLISCILSPRPFFNERALPVMGRALDIPWSAYRKWLMRRRRHDRVSITPCNDPSLNFNQFLDCNKVCGDRSSDFMNWRVESNPMGQIQTLLIHEDTKWIGYAVCKVMNRTTEIIELRLKSPEKSHIQALIRHLYNHWKNDSIDLWCFGTSPEKSICRRLGFVQRKFTGSVFAHRIEENGLPSDPASWDLTFLDSDW